MCLIIFAHQADPRYRLVVAANRDEFFARPTNHAHFWTESDKKSQILAGKDIVAGGTWLGLTRSGRFAAVTNFRDPSQPEKKPKSRGQLTLDFLAGNQSPLDYCGMLQEHLDEFAGYNLLVGDQHSMCYVNNFEEKLIELKPGIYGLSNGLLNSSWPKVEKGRDSLKALLASDVQEDSVSTDRLIDMMNDRSLVKVEDLPDTGIPKELEHSLSPAFIQNQQRQYGTLCTSAVIFENLGVSRFSEQNYDNSGMATERIFFEFNLV
jgi:uncharacterized protein with NRDE domain|tara:strand:- start:486 stop:1277 length:792 start_codon:yes stop_codon:yes gene_type:complete